MPAPIKAEVVNAFLQPALELLRAHFHQSDLARVAVTQELAALPSVAVDMVLRGGLRGPIRWTFAAPVARALASGMGVEAVSADISDPECLDAMAEVANIIVGNATGALEEAGYPVELQPPTASTLSGARPMTLDERALVVTLQTPKGEVRVAFSLQTG